MAAYLTVGLTTTIPYCGDTIPYRYEATTIDDGGVRQRVQLDNYAATSTLAHAHQLWMREDGFDPQGYLVATAAAAAAAEANAAAAGRLRPVSSSELTVVSVGNPTVVALARRQRQQQLLWKLSMVLWS